MKHYLFCIGAPWGYRVVERLRDAISCEVFDKARVETCQAIRWRTWRYVFFLNYSWLVPLHTLALMQEAVNFHATPLPFGRGGAPIENMILRDFDSTVITAHRMIAEIDAGPIYCVSEPVSLAGTKEQILARFVLPVTRMIKEIIALEPIPVAQSGTPVYFKRLPPDEYQRFWQARESEVSKCAS